MAELRFDIEKSFINKLEEDTKLKKTELTKEALGLLAWAVEQVKNGKKVVSIDEATNQKTEPILSSLTNAKK